MALPGVVAGASTAATADGIATQETVSANASLMNASDIKNKIGKKAEENSAGYI
ncbi:hypothetical protein IP92_05485 [Pseudoduganella flava]|uniref:Toxin CdiA n=1 Tax=Pseudoduganella flava TaxID=871742 RepID=A0A562PDM0_9BURK|nr:hypothetical protein [Pseudoduganella flava]QGZ42120.1 hypothetical protein GO485_25800 [Pseudoduganella flava]TWI42509.1 hypothetical protein IP92_05485 [Pseudoduganella flava]